MARFGLWAGDDYYPSPALGDYVGEFESQEMAEDKGKEKISKGADGRQCDWYVVVDLDKMTEESEGSR